MQNLDIQMRLWNKPIHLLHRTVYNWKIKICMHTLDFAFYSNMKAVYDN